MREDKPGRPTLLGRALGVALVVVVIALAARLTWALLAPVVPSLLAILLLVGIGRLWFGRRH